MAALLTAGSRRGPALLRMAIVCDVYSEAQVSRENFANVKRAYGWAP
jgi:hypothetical protein